MTAKKCAIYTRVSTDNQAEKEFSSCEAQEQKIRSFIESQDWQVSDVYSDGGFSGATLERPAIQRLLRDVKKKKVDIVLVYKIDRLTRSPKDFYQLIETFERANLDFISITERFDTSTPAGRLLRNIMLTFSQFERELTSERTKDKLLERAKKGLCNGGNVPYGYIRQDKKIIPHPKERDVIKSIFETYLETQSVAAVYNFLKDNGIRNRQDNLFCNTNISNLLRNPIYTGKVLHTGSLYDGIHEPIIGKEVFDFAQTLHKSRTKKFRVYKYFPFGGLIRCESCNSIMSACFTNKHSKGKLKRYYYYRCTKTMKYDWSSCPVKQVSADRLEYYCMKYVERIAIDKSYVENLAFRINNDLMKRYGAGNEPSEVCSPSFQITPENISETLSNFVAALANAKGIEKNLVAKKYIAKINYAPDVIKLSFLLKDNSALALDGKNYAPDDPIEKYATVLKTEKPASFEEPVVRSYSQTWGTRIRT